MSRITAVVAIAVLLFATPIAADLALQNPTNTPNSSNVSAQQTNFVETAGAFVEIAPVALLVGVVGVALAATRGFGGGGR
jgi:beta-lactamase regulating signal transducer with metallopeptidase domain